MMILLTQPVLLCPVSPSLVYPHEHVSASLVWEPCPLARSCVLAGLMICPSVKEHAQQVFFSLVETINRATAGTENPMPARVGECLRLTGSGAIDGSNPLHALSCETRQGGHSVRGAERRSDTVPCNFKNSHLTGFR